MFINFLLRPVWNRNSYVVIGYLKELTQSVRISPHTNLHFVYLAVGRHEQHRRCQ
jgi:hypothetical protein